MKQYSYKLPNINVISNRPLPYPVGYTADAEYNIEFQIGSVTSTREFRQVSEFCFGNEDADEINFTASPMPPIKFRMYIRGITGNRTLIEFNRSYNNVIRGAIGQLCPPEMHLDDLITIKLLAGGMTPVHGAAVEINNKCLLIIAPPGVGKSLTSAVAIKNGAKLMSDDMVITDGNQIYPMFGVIHYSSTTIPEILNRSNFKVKMLRLINESFPFVYYLYRLPSFQLQEFNIPTVESGKVDAVILLLNGENGLHKLSKQDSLNRILAINRRELHYFKNELLLSFSCFNKGLDLEGLMAKECSILDELVGNHPTYLCTAPNPYDYWEVISKNIFKGFD